MGRCSFKRLILAERSQKQFSFTSRSQRAAEGGQGEFRQHARTRSEAQSEPRRREPPTTSSSRERSDRRPSPAKRDEGSLPSTPKVKQASVNKLLHNTNSQHKKAGKEEVVGGEEAPSSASKAKPETRPSRPTGSNTREG